MKIVVTGATGFIGSVLCERLHKYGYKVTAFSREPDKAKILADYAEIIEWDGSSVDVLSNCFEGDYGIVNLIGENIGSGLWTHAKKKMILESRVNAGKAITEAIKKVKIKPRVLIQASAAGYYGSHGDEIIDESFPVGTGFLPGVAAEWEDSTKEVEDLNIRRVIVRTGVVLGENGGALPRLKTTFHLFLGGHIGNGKQWFSWIHIDDQVEAICFLLKNNALKGIYNLTAPNPLEMKEFCHILGKVMGRPSSLFVPGFVIRMLMGEMAKEMLLSGQRVFPKRLIDAGYKFIYSDAKDALEAIFKK
ncbi:MAG: TIGR01777 family oxidoreductase [bacterium]|nr:TIGR01777 family oxidoreductase [bacterium]